MKTISTFWLVAKPVGWRRRPVFAILVTALALPCFSGQGAATPAVTITSPAAGARTTAPVTFAGTASESAATIANVNYWITNLNGSPLTQGQAVLTAGPGSASKWTVTVSPPAGFNVLAVQSVDSTGNLSKMETVKFLLKSPSPLTVATAATNGAAGGTVTGRSFISGDTVPANNALLNVGETYALTARPGLNYFFDNWTGTALNTVGATNGSTLEFIMEPGTTITANFITNIFTQMAGTYYGLFSNANAMPTEETSGLIGNLRFTSQGVYSGVVYMGGSAAVITGLFTHDGYATNRATNILLDGNVQVELAMNPNSNLRTITGSLIGTNTIVVNNANQAGWTSQLTMYASFTNTSQFARAYTMLISPTPSVNGPTQGYGYACLTNYPGAGRYQGNPAIPPFLYMIGALSDWAGLTQTWPICEDNAIPVYDNYYNTSNPGMLFGKVNLYTNSTTMSPALSGTLTWIKRPSPYSLVFTNGFTNYAVVQGSYWSNLVPLDTVISNNSELILSNITSMPVTNLVHVSYTNLLSQKGITNNYGVTNYPYFYSAYIYPNTGELTVVFTNYSVPGARYAAGRGVVLQNSNTGGGFFILGTARFPTNIGSILLQPPPF